MKLDSKAMRHLTADDWRVLTAVETGSKNHEIVPTSLIERIARLRGGAGATRRAISALAKAGLVARPRDGGRTGGGKAGYEGYRLTYGGLDYLALRAHSQRGQVYAVGTRIGVGKESDIMAVADDAGRQRVLKIHRLGRVSFRTVRANRDYQRRGRGRDRGRDQGHGGSWLYLSRLAAEREFAFMCALRGEGFRVPEPLAQSRHTVLMELVEGAVPLRQVSAVGDPAALYAELVAVILRLARHGLIHGDFNEFNILLREDKTDDDVDDGDGDDNDNDNDNDNNNNSADKSGEEKGGLTATPIIIDFPQMVSMDHPNAEMYFDRDVACVRRFFARRFHFVSDEPGPTFRDARDALARGGARRLDAAVEASGFTKKMLKDLEAAIREQREVRDGDGDEDRDGGLLGDDGDGADEDEDIGGDGAGFTDEDGNSGGADDLGEAEEGDDNNYADDGIKVERRQRSGSRGGEGSPSRIDMSKLSVNDGT